MQPTGSLANLAERMKEKAEQERQQIESIVSNELTALRRNLESATRNAFNTIKNDMEGEIKNARWTIKDQAQTLCLSIGQRWLMVSLTALAATIGVALGGWGLTKLMERKITNLHQEISQLQQRQASQETAVKQLEAKTWGLELLESPEGRFIILPPRAQEGFTTAELVDFLAEHGITVKAHNLARYLREHGSPTVKPPVKPEQQVSKSAASIFEPENHKTSLIQNDPHQ